MVVEPKITITTVLADFNLVDRYGIAISIIVCKCEILADFSLMVVQTDRQTTKF